MGAVHDGGSTPRGFPDTKQPHKLTARCRCRGLKRIWLCLRDQLNEACRWRELMHDATWRARALKILHARNPRQENAVLLNNTDWRTTSGWPSDVPSNLIPYLSTDTIDPRHTLALGFTACADLSNASQIGGLMPASFQICAQLPAEAPAACVPRATQHSEAFASLDGATPSDMFDSRPQRI